MERGWRYALVHGAIAGQWSPADLIPLQAPGPRLERPAELMASPRIVRRVPGSVVSQITAAASVPITNTCNRNTACHKRAPPDGRYKRGSSARQPAPLQNLPNIAQHRLISHKTHTSRSLLHPAAEQRTETRPRVRHRPQPTAAPPSGRHYFALSSFAPS